MASRNEDHIRISYSTLRTTLLAAGAVAAAGYSIFYGRRWYQRERRKALLKHVSLQ